MKCAKEAPGHRMWDRCSLVLHSKPSWAYDKAIYSLPYIMYRENNPYALKNENCIMTSYSLMKEYYCIVFLY